VLRPVVDVERFHVVKENRTCQHIGPIKSAMLVDPHTLRADLSSMT
jgi:hypothetical protein